MRKCGLTGGLLPKCISMLFPLRKKCFLNIPAGKQVLCTDLDFFDRQDLSELLFHNYCDCASIERNAETALLFNYYKSYRANVRAKVTILKAQEESPRKNRGHVKDAMKFMGLMERYMTCI
jgi:aminoglycoside phosphotransferase family enzyme